MCKPERVAQFETGDTIRWDSVTTAVQALSEEEQALEAELLSEDESSVESELELEEYLASLEAETEGPQE